MTRTQPKHCLGNHHETNQRGKGHEFKSRPGLHTTPTGNTSSSVHNPTKIPSEKTPNKREEHRKRKLRPNINHNSPIRKLPNRLRTSKPSNNRTSNIRKEQERSNNVNHHETQVT